MKNFQNYTNKELRKIALNAVCGVASNVLNLDTAKLNEYYQIRKQLGWPNSRSIHQRLITSGRRN